MKPTILTKITALLAALVLSCGWAAAQSGKISGQLKEAGEPLLNQKVELLLNGVFFRGALTDESGRYEFSLLEPGTYTIKSTNLGHDFTTQVVLARGVSEQANMDLALVIDSDPITDFAGVPFTVDPMMPVTVTHEILLESGIRTVRDAAALAPGMYQADKGSPLQFRGGRPGSTVTFVDGIKMIGTESLPQAMTGQVTVLSGGVPAEYGDFTGGAVIVETHNPGMTPYIGKRLSKGERKELRRQQKEGSPVPGSNLPSDPGFAANF